MAAGRAAGAQDLREHACEVLGVPLLFNTKCVWDRMPPLPSTCSRVRTSKEEERHCAAMLLPSNGELFSIYIDERQGMFVQAQDNPDALYILHEQWHSLRSLLPADSSCLAVVYRCGAGHLNMGLFDMLRLAGKDLHSSPIFSRQKDLHEVFRRAPPACMIRQHWVGMQGSLLEYLKTSLHLVPFPVSHVLHLPDASAADFHMLLLPVKVPLNSIACVAHHHFSLK